MAKQVDITYFCDTTAIIQSKDYISDGAGGFTTNPQYVNVVSGYLEPVTGGQVVSAGQIVIEASHVFCTAVPTLANNGDIVEIGPLSFTVSYYEEPVNVQLGSYYAIYLKQIIN